MMTIQDFVKNNMKNMTEDIQALVRIPSVFREEDAGDMQPFGGAVREGLEWILDRARNMGMQVRNYDGYAGEITVGSGAYMVGVLAHEDVVPAGEGWDTPAFEPVIKEGRIYGRGTSDDKGPLISSLYAMKYLMDENKLPEGTSLRMIVGTNEEELWGGINYYVEKADRLPDCSIVPDGYFPLVFCEKGLLDIYFETSLSSEKAVKVVRLEGGSGRNVVPGSAVCVLDIGPLSAQNILSGISDKAGRMDFAGENVFEGVTLEAEGNLLRIFAEGKSTHAMSPEKGVNAVSVLMRALKHLPLETELDDLVESYERAIAMEYNGESFGCGFEDELSGKLTFNIGTIGMEQGRIKMEANLRYPASMQKDVVVSALQAGSEKAGWEMEVYDALPPVYTKPDSPFVKELMRVYREVTGDLEHDAFAIGGATYARAIPNAAAFGPLFPYEEELAHEANEFLALDSLERMTEIYAGALEALLGLDPESVR
ncbi:MAG: Sapep family Mn(2+)-dependent dipeptidase [Anaerovoracaceae bacterium]